MLKAIRNIKFGWIIILIGIILILSGISMIEGKAGDKTFLCFDEACISVQGISNIALGLLCLGVGFFKIKK